MKRREKNGCRAGCVVWVVAASVMGCGKQGATGTDDGSPNGIRAVAIAAGAWHTCAVLDSGICECWGCDDEGQLGNDGTKASQGTPAVVSGLRTGVSTVATGREHTCALTSGGQLMCWGNDIFGQLGDDGYNWWEGTPVSVWLTSTATAVATGHDHTCAILGSGGVACWGMNYYGQLGDGATNMDSDLPVAVAALPAGTIAVSAGGDHTCALLPGGGVMCWGNNDAGQLGDAGVNTTTNTPVNVSGLASGVTAIAAGGEHTCALLSTGSVMCWGGNTYGQLGDGQVNAGRNTPASVPELANGVAAIAAGWGHTCALLATGGVKCWGDGTYGQLGNGAATYHVPRPVDVSGLSTGVVAIAAGGQHTCGLRDDGAVLCWGRDDDGQLGDGGANTGKTTPVEVEWF